MPLVAGYDGPSGQYRFRLSNSWSKWMECRINEEMKYAVHAIAALAKEDIPESVTKSYQNAGNMEYGREYLIPNHLILDCY